MFGNLLRYWLRETLEDAVRQKMAEMRSSEDQSAAGQAEEPSARPAGSQNQRASSGGAAGCEASGGMPTEDSTQQRSEWPRASGQLQPSDPKSEKPLPSCNVGVVFALESESGGLEDLVHETGRWRGNGFTVIGGRLEDRQVVIVRSGAGQTAAAHATEALLDGHGPQWVISAGFAGATQAQLQRYDLVLPDAVIRPDGTRVELSPPADWLAQTAFGPVHRGLLVSVDHLVSSPKEKRTLGEKFSALAVDMETFAVVDVCKRRGTPAVAVRIIIDTLDEQLPPEVRSLLKQKTAAARLGAALGALWYRPSSWKDLYRLKEQALLASDRLARFLAWAIKHF